LVLIIFLHFQHCHVNFITNALNYHFHFLIHLKHCFGVFFLCLRMKNHEDSLPDFPVFNYQFIEHQLFNLIWSFQNFYCLFSSYLDAVILKLHCYFHHLIRGLTFLIVDFQCLSFLRLHQWFMLKFLDQKEFP